MKCFQCGTELSKESKFCPKCGEFQGFSKELVERAKNGDQDAISELYNRTYNNVYFTVKALIQSEDTILDIVQDSYVKGFESLSQLQDSDKFRAWMKKIAHNKAVDYLRKAKPVMFSAMSTEEDEVIEFEDDRPENLPEIVIDQQETTRLIKEILDSLSAEQRLVVGMFYYEQMSVKEIAETLGVSENTVKSRLSYGRKKIEIQVKELEKQGTKLYSLAPLPFVLLLFKNATAQAAQSPNPALLQSIQKQCSSASVNPRGCVQSGASKAGAAAKTVTGTVSKGFATKMIAGIAALAVIGGAAAAITTAQKKGEPQRTEQTISTEREEVQVEQEPTEKKPEDKREEQKKLSPEEIYQPILDQYAVAMAMDPYDENVQFSTINHVMLNYYYQQQGNHDGTTSMGFYYDYYDIDGNGTQELLISYGAESKNIVDVYAMKENQPKKLIEDDSLGERSQLYIYPDGKMILVGSGGANLHGITVYTFEQDGFTLAEANETLEGQFDLNAVLAEKSGNQAAVNGSDGTAPLDWKPIDPIWEIEIDGNPQEYVGQYVNGNDWNAGKITIEARDEHSVTVRLEAFKTRSDRELSTIFEGVGYKTKDGLVIYIDGKQAKITDSPYGFYFDAPPSCKQEWMLDPYLYNSEYSSIGTEKETNDSTETGGVDFTNYNGYSYINEQSRGFRLDTADGTLAFTHIIQEWLPGRSEASTGEYTYVMNLETADISGNTYTIYNMSTPSGEDRSFQFHSVQFTFEEDKVIMIVDSDETKFPGGAANVLHSGTYELTNNEMGNSNE